MLTNQLPYWLAALQSSRGSPRQWMRWLNQFGDMQTLFMAPREALISAKVPEELIQLLKNPPWAAVDRELAWLSAAPYRRLVTWCDPEYPRLLREIPDPPLALYVSGDVAALGLPQLAMVGSRHPTAMGMKTAEQFAASLASHGLGITSGLAIGIDYACHQGALSEAGVTIAVLGTGLNHLYPQKHKPLAEAILAKQGVIVSEFPINTPPHPYHFPRRNRIISGLSLGVMVVEAALKSGSLITARYALEQGREVFAVPGSIQQPLARGCHALIREGAKLVETAQDVLEELGSLFKASREDPVVKKTSTDDKLADLSKEYREFLEHIDKELTLVDIIILRSGLTAAAVSSMLLNLELAGYVQAVSGGYINLVSGCAIK